MNTAHLDMHDKQGTHAPEESRWISPGEAMEILSVAVTQAIDLHKHGWRDEAQAVLCDARKATARALAERARDFAEDDKECGPRSLNPINQSNEE